MRLRTFTAASMAEAMLAVREAMGPDAIILSEKRGVGGSVEIKAAVEQEAIAVPQAADPTPPVAPIYARTEVPTLEAALLWAGANGHDALRLGRFSERSHNQPIKQQLIAALGSELRCSPFSTTPENSLALVGLPGAGRTSVAAKLAARALQCGAQPILIAADLERAGGCAALAGFAERLNCSLREAGDREGLAMAVSRAVASGTFGVVDCPASAGLGTDFISADVARARLGGAEPVLVLAADGHPDDMAETAACYASAGVSRVILTRFDLTRRRAGAIMAVAGSGLAFAQVSESPFIGTGLAPASAARFARLILDTLPQSFLAKSDVQSECAA